MAIFQKAYRGYDGELSPLFYRTWVIFRYGLADIFSSRLFIAFFVVCFAPTIIVLLAIYMRYNLDALLQLEVNVTELVYIDAAFFADWVLWPQFYFVFFLIMVMGPSLVAPDLRNNAMPLYLSRPISKLSYLVGKYLVLLVLASAISWVPCVLLILYQGYLAGNGWLAANAALPFAAIGTSMIWITTLSLLSFAITTAVKWAPIARLVFFGIVFVSATLGKVISAIVGIWSGSFFDVFELIRALERSWFGLGDVVMPASTAISMLMAIAIVCVFVIMARIRANEVV